jgi:hypothetical protein
MKKWKIKGSREFQRLLERLKLDEKIESYWDGGAHNIYYFNVDNKVLFSSNDNEKLLLTSQHEEVTVEELEKLYYSTSTIEKWSVGSYIIITDKPSHVGIIEDLHAVCKITSESDGCISTKNDCLAKSRENDGQIKWFATKQEAEDFAKTLTVISTEPSKSKYLIAAEKALKHFEDAGFYVGCEYEDTKGDVFVSHRKLRINQSDNNDCYIDCGSGFLWEYQNEEECLDVYGKLIIEDKPQSIEREFQIGDRVECTIDCNIVSEGMQGTIVDITSCYFGVSWDTLTNGHNCEDTCASGTGWNINKKHIKLISTTTISNFSPKIILNTYGLKIGDELNAEVISAWSGKTGNRSTDTKTEWHQHEGSFVGNRKIINFYLIHGQVGFEVSATCIVYLKAEGFKEFSDNYYKQKPVHPQDAYDIIMHQREQLIQEESNQTQKLLTLPTNKIYVRKSKSIK